MTLEAGIDLVTEARAATKSCTPAEAAELRTDAHVLIDIREPPEHAQASIPGAVPVPRGVLEFRIAELCGTPDAPILLHCASGGRALLAAKTLQEMGYRDVCAVVGPFEDLLAALS